LLAAWLAGHAGGKDTMGLFWLSAASLTVLAVNGMGWLAHSMASWGCALPIGGLL
jgi:hypothetical protein